MEDFVPIQKHSSLTSLPFVSRPSAGDELVPFASDQDGFEAHVSRAVLANISRRAEEAGSNETIGLLAGRIMRDEKGPYTLVLAAEGARADETEASRSHVHMSARGQALVRRRLENSAYGLDIVGWYHSHPTFEALFSGVDRETQATWGGDNHIGIVISGLKHVETFGVYRGPGSQRLIQRDAPPPLPPPVEDREDHSLNDGVTSDAAVGGDADGSVAGLRGAASPRGAASFRAPAPPASRQRTLTLLLAVLVFSTLAGVVLLDYRLGRVEEELKRLARAGDAGTGRVVAPALPRTHAAEESTAAGDALLGEQPVSVRANPKLPAPAAPARTAAARKAGKAGANKPPGEAAGKASGKAAKSKGNGGGKKSGAARGGDGTQPAPQTKPQATPSPDGGT